MMPKASFILVVKLGKYLLVKYYLYNNAFVSVWFPEGPPTPRGKWNQDENDGQI